MDQFRAQGEQIVLSPWTGSMTMTRLKARLSLIIITIVVGIILPIIISISSIIAIFVSISIAITHNCTFIILAIRNPSICSAAFLADLWCCRRSEGAILWYSIFTHSSADEPMRNTLSKNAEVSPVRMAIIVMILVLVIIVMLFKVLLRSHSCVRPFRAKVVAKTCQYLHARSFSRGNSPKYQYGKIPIGLHILLQSAYMLSSGSLPFQGNPLLDPDGAPTICHRRPSGLRLLHAVS